MASPNPVNKVGIAPSGSHPVLVTFESHRSGLQWNALFDLGSDDENTHAALELAWKRNARILAACEPTPKAAEPT